jgi:hypothetical protein
MGEIATAHLTAVETAAMPLFHNISCPSPPSD